MVVSFITLSPAVAREVEEEVSATWRPRRRVAPAAATRAGAE
jgi:hypothetical protein